MHNSLNIYVLHKFSNFIALPCTMTAVASERQRILPRNLWKYLYQVCEDLDFHLLNQPARISKHGPLALVYALLHGIGFIIFVMFHKNIRAKLRKKTRNKTCNTDTSFYKAPNHLSKSQVSLEFLV